MRGPVEWSRATGSIHAASPVAYRLYDGKLVGRAASHDGITCKPKTCSATGRHYILAEKKAFCLGEVVDVCVWEKEKKKERNRRTERARQVSKPIGEYLDSVAIHLVRLSRPTILIHTFLAHYALLYRRIMWIMLCAKVIGSDKSACSIPHAQARSNEDSVTVIPWWTNAARAMQTIVMDRRVSVDIGSLTSL